MRCSRSQHKDESFRDGRTSSSGPGGAVRCGAVQRGCGAGGCVLRERTLTAACAATSQMGQLSTSPAAE